MAFKSDPAQDAFRRAFAIAIIRTALNPERPNHELTGSFADLRAELKRIGGNLSTLRRMTKPRTENGGFGRLILSEDWWSFTTGGVSEYNDYLDEARAEEGLG